MCTYVCGSDAMAEVVPIKGLPYILKKLHNWQLNGIRADYIWVSVNLCWMRFFIPDNPIYYFDFVG